MNLFELMLHASLMVKLVLLCLLLLSVFSWGIMFYKHYHLGRAASESAVFMQAFESGAPASQLAELARTLPASPIAGVFLRVAGLKEGLSADRLRSALGRATVSESQRLQAHLIILATTGSSAPFIGLFGTVWGIVHAFQEIGASGSASLAVVAPGIAEALVTTAAGLAAAIPAVVAYNHQSNRAGQLADEMEPVTAELLGFITGKRG
jgi:biopolymer transport protein TolQ